MGDRDAGDGRWVGGDFAAGSGGVAVGVGVAAGVVGLGVGMSVAVEVTTGGELVHAPATTAITPETSNGNQSPASRRHRESPVCANTLIF